MKKTHSVRTRDASRPRLKGWKRWAFPLAAMILIPGLLFGLAEGMLRVIGYGFPTSFFVKQTVDGNPLYTENRQYGWRFFPQRVARRPADFQLPVVKGEKTFRVFVLGESAAMGDPDTAYSIPRMLEVMLSERFPSTRFEVVNAAMTGISSHVIRDIAGDVARLQPDCFVIYMGNNEAIGPYGPGTVFASFSRYLPLTHLSIAARTLKISQLIDNAIRSRSNNEPQAWGGLRVFMKSQFHPTDDRVRVLADHLQRNLEDICKEGLGAGAKVVLCNVASNLKDCSPFASLNAPSLTPEQKASFDALWNTAAKLEAEGKMEAALAACLDAEKIDGSCAELHFRKGQLYSALKRFEEAHESFQRARDCDALKFRTSSDLNARAKQVAEALPASDSAFVDIVNALQQDAKGAGIGSNYFVDHVHFNFRGNYLVAREILSAISRFVPGGQNAPATVMTEEQCAERLAFTRWNDARIAAYMLQRFEIPPFNAKSDYRDRTEELKARIAQLQSAMTPAGLKEAVAGYEKALQRRKNDPDFLRSLAELHADLEESAREVAYRQKLCELFPYDEERKAFLATAYARSDDYAKGEALALEVLRKDPDHVVARVAYGTALENKGAIQEAITQYTEVLKLRPDLEVVQSRLKDLLKNDRTPQPVLPGATAAVASAPGDAMNHFKLGEAYLQQGNLEQGTQQLVAAIQLQPDLVEARMALAGVLIEQGKINEAIAQCKEAIRLRPDFVQMHINLGALLIDLQRYAEARPHLEEALRLQPDNEDAQLNLGLSFMRDNQPAQALVHLESFIKKNVDDHAMHMQMGTLYESVGKWERAAHSFAEAIRVQPTNGQYQCSLAWVLATSPQDGVRNGAEAVRLAEQALRADQQLYTLDTLAAALAEDGQYAEAVKRAEEALALAHAANDPAASGIDQRVALYRDRQPYRVQVASSTQP